MAAKYSQVDKGLWRRRKFKRLTDDEKLLFLYLKTCDQNNIIGCYYCPILYMQSEIGWSHGKIIQMLGSKSLEEFVRYDHDHEHVYLVKHLEFHPVQNVNQAKGAETLFYELPQGLDFVEHLAGSLSQQKSLSKGFVKALETLCNNVTVTVTVTGTVNETQTDLLDFVDPSDFSSRFDELFDWFWKYYPRKESKKKAKLAFKKACDGDTGTAEGIIRAIRIQAGNRYHRTEKKFIPLPTTWLNGERWDDEYSPDTDPEDPMIAAVERL